MDSPSHPEKSARSISQMGHDFLASIVVFLVALPLCMGVAIASGVPVSAGLFSGIVAGLVVGTLAGCPLQVSGPAAGLAVLVFELVQTYGFELLGAMVFVAGLLQILAGGLRLGQWFRAVSPAVIRGMLAGIGVLIFASQFHVMVDAKPSGSAWRDILSIPDSIRKSFTQIGLAPRDQRAFRTEHLRLIVVLRSEQVEINKEVLKLLPSSAEPDAFAAELEQKLESEPEEFAQLAARQREVASTLGDINSVVREFEGAADSDIAARIIAASTATDLKMEKVVNDLQARALLEAVQSQAEIVEAFEEYLASLKNHGIAAQLGLLTIGIIVLWPLLVPRLLKPVPAPLVAVVVTTVVAYSLVLPVLYVVIPDNLLGEINWLRLGYFLQPDWSGMLQGAIVLAAVASAETLLCATATDQLHSGPRTQYNRELIAQGAGNAVCGILGALPVTGVIVRSTTNIQAGGRTRLAAILHGLWLLLFVALLSAVLRLIPTSALAAILVYTGFRLMNPSAVRELAEFGWAEVAVFLVTVITIVIFGLLTGIVTGFILATIKLLHRLSQLRAQLTVDGEAGTAQLKLSGSATFLGLPRLANKLENVPPGTRLYVYFDGLDSIDHACLDLFKSWSKQHAENGGETHIDWKSLYAKYEEEPLSVRRADANEQPSNEQPSNEQPSGGGN